jgi:hypothetical protein
MRTIGCPRSRKRSATLTPWSSSPPGLPRRSSRIERAPEPAQRVDGLAHLVRGRVGERIHVEVADAVAEHDDPSHRAHVHLVARERERDAPSTPGRSTASRTFVFGAPRVRRIAS